MKYEKRFKPTIKMWQVQTEGAAKLGYGLISRGNGFTDSPDAEYISGGDHTKLSNNVAIGRHGNFFHWGYSGSPRFMTEQAKKVFVNAVHYIARFKGQRILSKKVSRQWLSDWGKMKLDMDYKKAYKSDIAQTKQMNANIQAAKDRKAKGEKPGEYDKWYVNRPLNAIPTFEEFLKGTEPQLYPKFGTYLPKYREYYNKYIDYMRPDYKVIMSPIVDMDAYRLGLSFKDTKFLPTCIKALKDSEKKDIALKLLKRYTNESFENTKNWKKWYKKNKSRLFFTEAGGFKYFVNIYK